MSQVVGNPCWGVVQQMSGRRQSEPHICLSSWTAPKTGPRSLLSLASLRRCLASAWGATSDLNNTSSNLLGFVFLFQHQRSCIAPIFPGSRWFHCFPFLFWLCELLCCPGGGCCVAGRWTRVGLRQRSGRYLHGSVLTG